MTIGFIGAGHMASALLSGILSSGEKGTKIGDAVSAMNEVV